MREGGVKKRCRLEEEESQTGAETNFWVYGQALASATSFLYLCFILTATDDVCPEVVGNLMYACWSWVQLSRILGREGVDARTSLCFYLSIVQ